MSIYHCLRCNGFVHTTNLNIKDAMDLARKINSKVNKYNYYKKHIKAKSFTTNLGDDKREILIIRHNETNDLISINSHFFNIESETIYIDIP